MAIANTRIFEVSSRDLWGDYGSNLINANASRTAWSKAPLRLTRTGPFVPPLCTTAGGATLLVSDAVKRKIEQERPFPVKFRKTTYDFVYPIEWHIWDFSTDLPAQLPETGEPDDYFHGTSFFGPTSEFVQQMESTWELVLPILPCKVRYLEDRTQSVTLGDASYAGLFNESKNWLRALCDLSTRIWLEQQLGEWVRFEELKASYQ